MSSSPGARIPALLGIGLTAGVFSGLFGVGGGLIVVPGLVAVLGLEHRRAVGTSLLAITPAVLASLERLHDPASVRRAMGDARAAGYANVNLDLIYCAEGERLESWERTLRETVDLAPEHVSAYALTIEASTPLGRKVQHGVVRAPDPDLRRLSL